MDNESNGGKCKSNPSSEPIAPAVCSLHGAKMSVSPIRFALAQLALGRRYALSDPVRCCVRSLRSESPYNPRHQQHFQDYLYHLALPRSGHFLLRIFRSPLQHYNLSKLQSSLDTCNTSRTIPSIKLNHPNASIGSVTQAPLLLTQANT